LITKLFTNKFNYININEFDIERVQKGGAVFNIDKLNWLNSEYLREIDVDEFIKLTKDFLPKSWKLTVEIANSVKGRVEKLSEIKDMVDFYFELPDYDGSLLRWKNSSLQDAATHLEEGIDFIKDIPEEEFTREKLEDKILNKLSKESRGDTLWPIRVALSGKKASPGPFEIMEALGREESIERIQKAIQKTGILDI